MIIAERQSLLSEEISTAETRSEFMLVMNRLTRVFDLAYFTILSAPGPTDTLLAPLVLESTMPIQFVREFDRAHFLKNCPILPRMNDSILPQRWALDELGPSPDFDCPPKMFELMRRFNLLMGAIFTLNSVDGSRYFIRFDGARAPLTQSEMNELGMLALYAFDSIDRMRRADIAVPNVLSARELEVLRWTAQGKTSVEIGQILSLSDHTVNAYMTNAIKKLDCVNRTQLVAKAIRLKLIN
ncbi:MAG: LuxR C-terminal-related transcriptional regulator [Allorhizobium sp.]